jgi:hypothetical protein
MNKAGQLLDLFLTEAFNNDGGYKPTDFEKRPSKHNCNFCPYKDNSNLCDKNEKPIPTFAFFKPA